MKSRLGRIGRARGRRQDDLSRDVAPLASSMLHDIRTPMSALTGAQQMLADSRSGTLSAEQRGLLEDAQRATRRVQDGLIELGQILEQPWVPAHRNTDLVEMVRLVVDDCNHLFSRHLRIVLQVSGSLAEIQVDPLMMRHVLLNLLANAAQYSATQSPVLVELSQEGQLTLIRVIDHGVGIPAAERVQVFDSGYRGSAAADTPGSGRGLALCRKLLALHDGTLTLQDTPGGGATFTVRLPITQATPEATPV